MKRQTLADRILGAPAPKYMPHDYIGALKTWEYLQYGSMNSGAATLTSAWC